MTIYLIVLLAFLTHVGFAGSRLLVPLYALDRGATPFIVGTVIALYPFFPAMLALPAGRAMDRMGFRLPMLAGAIAVFAGLVLPWFFPALQTLYVSATLLGIGFMAFQLSTQTLAGAIAEPQDRARNFSYLSLGFACANFTGPLLSGFLIDQIGYGRTFLTLSIPLLPVVAVAAMGSRWIPPVHAKAESHRGSVLDLLKIRDLRNTLIASGIVSSAWDVYQFFMPIYGRSQGLSATAIGMIVGCFALSIVLVRLVLPVFVRRTGEAQTLTYAMFVACGAFCLFPFFKSAVPLAAVSFLLGIGCGCGQPLSTTMVYNASPKGRAGEATAMRLTVNQVTHFAIPLIFGAVGSVAGFAAVFATNAGFLVVGGYISLRSHART